MPTKQEIQQFIDDLKKSYPIIFYGTTEEFVNGVMLAVHVFESEFGFPPGQKKDEL